MDGVAPCHYLFSELAVTPLCALKAATFGSNILGLFCPTIAHMGTPHGPHNQPPFWGHRYDTPTLPAPAGVSNAPASQMLKPSYPTRTHPPAPPTRPCRPPPRQHQTPGSHAYSASHCQQLDAGGFPPSSGGCYGQPPRPQNTPRIQSAPEFRQKVRARITADGWVLGIIVSALHLCSKFAGLGYTVEIESVEGSGRPEKREFSVEDLDPYWPRGCPT
ncbi:hypothetical protein H4582DRAFT_1944733 [Lactarius indigo]|nr:hypothetical protein H4582DRAFT_1944733 [Lactarius indigo]